MSYTNNSYEVEMVPFIPPSSAHPTANQNGVNLAATGIRAEWSPGVTPHTVHAIGIVPRSGHVRDNAVHVAFDADISTQGTATRVGKIVLPTTVTAAGEVVFWKPTYNVRILPGRVLQAAVTAAATAGSYGKITILVSPSWEEPANVTSMTQTT